MHESKLRSQFDNMKHKVTKSRDLHFLTFHLKEVQVSLSFKNTSYHALQLTLHVTSPFYSLQE